MCNKGKKVVIIMKNNVYLCSALRQPLKMGMLLLMIVLSTLAFVSRAAEYLMVKQEVERLGDYYRAVGTLEPNDKWADTSEAVRYLEDSPYVELVDTYHYTSGVIQDRFTNADTDLLTSDMSRYVVFYGTLWSYSDTYFHFIIDSVLTGPPEYVQEGTSAILYRGESQTISDVATAGLVKGKRYLAVGYYSLFPPSRIEYDPSTGKMTGTHMLLSCPLEKGVFYPVPEGREVDWSAPELEDIFVFIRDIQAEQASLNIVPTKDMSTLPLIQGSAPQIYLTDGRWLNGRDHAESTRSCVIHTGLASARHLAVGDSITLTLRDIPSCFGYFRPYPMWTNNYYPVKSKS